MKNNLSIWIPGQPSRTTHQSGTRISGKRTYKTASLIGWEKTLTRALMPYRPDQPIDGPIRLAVTWEYKAQKKKDLWRWKLTRPDTDNMQKTLKDVMTRIGFWKDDSQVVFEVCKKVWVDDPGIAIRVDEMDEDAGAWLWQGSKKVETVKNEI